MQDWTLWTLSLTNDVGWVSHELDQVRYKYEMAGLNFGNRIRSQLCSQEHSGGNKSLLLNEFYVLLLSPAINRQVV